MRGARTDERSEGAAPRTAAKSRGPSAANNGPATAA
eukprot:CAMPEP_0183592208 /NCGR_PEP_ID=MMETSP0371-20130417/167595_1 /TAXON_ID=268820 /ORGANISM="Peridinium aciculiferum, Strain PAER-2" /LENGTH=35 /DNA_ID= /DNA_START= /DNA_END= /DNA_ORIENTATION=